MSEFSFSAKKSRVQSPPSSRDGFESDPEGDDDVSGSEGDGLPSRLDQDSEDDANESAVPASLVVNSNITVEELSDDDNTYDGLEVIRPDQTEDAASLPDIDRSIAEVIRSWTCESDQAMEEHQRRFNYIQSEAYRRRKRRWNASSINKRSHAQVESSDSSEHEDVERLDDTFVVGASAHPIKEVKEKALPGVQPSLLDSGGDFSFTDEISDGAENIELLLPHWLMEEGTNIPSQPSTAAFFVPEVNDLKEGTPAIRNPLTQDSVVHESNTSGGTANEDQDFLRDDELSLNYSKRATVPPANRSHEVTGLWYCCQCKTIETTIAPGQTCFECYHIICEVCNDENPASSVALTLEPHVQSQNTKNNDRTAETLQTSSHGHQERILAHAQGSVSASSAFSAVEYNTDRASDSPNAGAERSHNDNLESKEHIASSDVKVDNVEDTISLKSDTEISNGTISSLLGNEDSVSGGEKDIIVDQAVGHDQEDASDAGTYYAGSVISAVYSNWSSSTIAADNFMAEELADFLWLDIDCQKLAVSAVSKTCIGQVRFQRNFTRLLRAFAGDLAHEAASKDQHAAAMFVRLSAAAVADDISARARCQQLDSGEPIADSENRRHILHNAEHITNSRGQQELAAADSDDEEFAGLEATEEDHYNLNEAKQFLSESHAMVLLRKSLQEFVYPSFNSILSRWAQREFEDREAKSCMSQLLRELTIAAPDTIVFTNYQPKLADQLKLSVEHKTGQEWDWWPCSTPKEPLREHWTRVEWQTTFGVPCWRNVPVECGKVVQRALREYRVNTITSKDLSPDRQSHEYCAAKESLNDPSSLNKGLVLWSWINSSWKSLIRSANNTQSQGPGTSAGTPMNISQPGTSGSFNHTFNPHISSTIPSGVGEPQIRQAATMNITGPNESPGHVLLLVQTSMSEDHDLSQIRLPKNMSTLVFFKLLRNTYLRSRGFARHFSVWKYHHCDFYHSIRFLPAKFTPHTKNNLPPKDHTDYRICDTARTRDPPPILPIEFYWGYYLSDKTIFAHLHSWWRGCGRQHDAEQAGVQQLQLRPDILRLLPRKITQLDESGVTREDFWNILAVERICLRWVVFWNVVCMSPAIGFFFLWLFKLGGVQDLQNASVPIVVVIMLEGLFWTLLWASTWGDSTGARIS